MVLGLRGKNKGSQSVEVDYLVHIQEIKPWPASQSFGSLRAVFIRWENGDRKSGSTKSVVPTLGSVVGEGKVDFNESFMLSLILLRELSNKNVDADTFHKNCLEFNLYELHKDKTVKGQLLANATLNFADFGVVKEVVSVSIPMTCKRSAGNTAEPFMFVRIQPAEKACPSSSLRDSLPKGTSFEKNGNLSVSAFMNDEYSDEAEIASFTDDDDDFSSHSSQTVSSSAFEPNSGPHHNEEDEIEAVTNYSTGGSKRKHTLASRLGLDISNLHQNASCGKWKTGQCSSSLDLSSDPPSPQNGHVSKPRSPCSSSMSEEKDVDSASRFSSPLKNSHILNENLESQDSHGLQANGQNSKKAGKIDRYFPEYVANTDYINSIYLQNKDGKEQEPEKRRLRLEEHFKKDKLSNEQGSIGQQVSTESKTYSLGKGNVGVMGNAQKIDLLSHIIYVQSPLDPGKSNGLPSARHHQDVKEVNFISDLQNGAGKPSGDGGNDIKVLPKDKTAHLESKIQQLENRIMRLEGKLRQAAAIEAALYSVAAEHGSSMRKVHTPARRLARLYLHAFEKEFKLQKATAAKAAISGLILVAKACGSDVPRLTFWLSNSVVMRAIISQAFEELNLGLSGASSTDMTSTRNGYSKMSSPPKCELSFSGRKENQNVLQESLKNMEDPCAFTSALEKVEAWIFSRIIESIWWQTMIPHMQSATVKAVDGNFSLDLWKTAFRDAFKRLCPLRAGGHECGCLPMLVRLVMKQCVARLDVAMFNAILREAVDETPTDPVSDPVSDAKVLPIPVGISSFAAGAQLKNMIGNWSRFLTDLIGTEGDYDSHEDEIDHDDIDERQDKCSKYFSLLNALSEIMMLPKDFLLSRSIRKEVCPTIGAPLIKRILDIFVPDEFCPDPIPDVVFDALASEDPYETGEECIVDFPCTVAPPQYSPPSPTFVEAIIRGVGSRSQPKRTGSSVLRKSYTSDDELEDLGSPLGVIFSDDSYGSPVKTKPSWLSEGDGNQYDVRYELLRDVWLNG